MRFSPALLLSLMTLGAGGATLATGLNWQPDLGTVGVAPAPAASAGQSRRDLHHAGHGAAPNLHDRPPFTPGRRPPPPATLRPRRNR